VLFFLCGSLGVHFSSPKKVRPFLVVAVTFKPTLNVQASKQRVENLAVDRGRGASRRGPTPMVQPAQWLIRPCIRLLCDICSHALYADNAVCTFSVHHCCLLQEGFVFVLVCLSVCAVVLTGVSLKRAINTAFTCLIDLMLYCVTGFQWCH